MDYMSIFIIHCPVWISKRVGKFYQVSKFGSRHNFFNLLKNKEHDSKPRLEKKSSLWHVTTLLHSQPESRFNCIMLSSVQSSCSVLDKYCSWPSLLLLFFVCLFFCQECSEVVFLCHLKMFLLWLNMVLWVSYNWSGNWISRNKGNVVKNNVLMPDAVFNSGL